MQIGTKNAISENGKNQYRIEGPFIFRTEYLQKFYRETVFLDTNTTITIQAKNTHDFWTQNPTIAKYIRVEENDTTRLNNCVVFLIPSLWSI